MAEILVREEIVDEHLSSGNLTVTEARMSPDLRHATIYVRPFAVADDGGTALLVALRQHVRFLRGEVAKRVNLKFAPDLVFRMDETFDEANKIDALLRSPTVRRDLS